MEDIFCDVSYLLVVAVY